MASKPNLAGLRSHARDNGAFVWVVLVEPTAEEFDQIQAEFGLHELAVEDALEAHQRPKLEHYDDTLFVVLKTVDYVDSEELVEIGELMIFLGQGFLIIGPARPPQPGRSPDRRSSRGRSC